MERATGKIVNDGGEEFRVDIELHHSAPQGYKTLTDWGGVLSLLDHLPDHRGGRYRLVLDDGREGDVIVDPMQPPPPDTERTFKGSGPLTPPAA